MELGDLFDRELKTKGVWLAFGPAPEWALVSALLQKRIDKLDNDESSAVLLRAQKEAIENDLAVTARVRIRFVSNEILEKIKNHPKKTGRISLALACVTGWEGLTSNGDDLEFNAKNLEAVALSNDLFVEFAGRACMNLPLLSAWRDREVKKN
ncbi:hypothetical protein MNBD_NITROSPINAE03-2048 [hydrothermal vent metagenome]|uniref:Uncharacterized protein n=1 Tax=hydrothermal vent metagenome TaxID=652676 RepID=A0A3B1C332_9ZZZZ